MLLMINQSISCCNLQWVKNLQILQIVSVLDSILLTRIDVQQTYHLPTAFLFALPASWNIGALFTQAHWTESKWHKVKKSIKQHALLSKYTVNLKSYRYTDTVPLYFSWHFVGKTMPMRYFLRMLWYYIIRWRNVKRLLVLQLLKWVHFGFTLNSILYKNGYKAFSYQSNVWFLKAQQWYLITVVKLSVVNAHIQCAFRNWLWKLQLLVKSFLWHLLCRLDLFERTLSMYQLSKLARIKCT